MMQSHYHSNTGFVALLHFEKARRYKINSQWVGGWVSERAISKKVNQSAACNHENLMLQYRAGISAGKLNVVVTERHK